MIEISDQFKNIRPLIASFINISLSGYIQFMSTIIKTTTTNVNQS